MIPSSPLSSDIFQRLGLEGLPENTQIDLMTKMTESVIKRIAVEVLERLSEDDRTALYALREKGDPDETERFLKSKIADYDGLADRTVAAFADEMRDTVAMLKKSA